MRCSPRPRAPAGRARYAWLLASALAVTRVPAETLQEAWSQAVAHDQSLAAVSAETAAAQANERAARGARWPSINADAGYTRLNVSPTMEASLQSGGTFQTGPIFRDNQYVSGGVHITMPLYAGGRIAAGIDAAHQSATGAGELEQATASTLRLQVAESYVAVLRARHALKAATSSLESLSAHGEDVQHLVESESVPQSDLLAARVAIANAQQAQVRAANAVEIALASYNRRLGQPLERPAELDERLPADTDLSAQPIEALIARALASRGELKAAAAQADALASQARAERGKLLPQLALTGGYTHFDNQILDRQDFSSVGVGFTWNLFDGGQARNRAAALRIEGKAQQSRLDDLRSQIALEVRQNWLDVQEAQARVKASREAVSQAQENLRMSRELYGVGLATNTQVLDAVSLQVQAINNRDNAVLDEALSRLRLARAVGEL